MQPSSCLLPVCILSLLTYIFLLWHVVGNAVIWLLITVQRGHMKLISKSASTSSPRRSTQSTLPSIVLFRPMRTRDCSIQIMKQFLPEQATKTSLSSDSLSLSLSHSLPLSLLLCFTSSLHFTHSEAQLSLSYLWLLINSKVSQSTEKVPVIVFKLIASGVGSTGNYSFQQCLIC